MSYGELPLCPSGNVMSVQYCSLSDLRPEIAAGFRRCLSENISVG
jgi:hypothetical protein